MNEWNIVKWYKTFRVPEHTHTHTHTNNIGTFLYDEDESIIVKWKAMTSIGRHFRLDHKLKNTTTLLLMETDWQTVPSWPGSHQNWIDHNRLDRSIWSTTTDGLEWNHNNGEREREREDEMKTWRKIFGLYDVIVHNNNNNNNNSSIQYTIIINGSSFAFNFFFFPPFIAWTLESIAQIYKKFEKWLWRSLIMI